MQIKDHKRVQLVGDEHVCRDCKKRWDRAEPEEDIPSCKPEEIIRITSKDIFTVSPDMKQGRWKCYTGDGREYNYTDFDKVRRFFIMNTGSYCEYQGPV